MAYAPGAGATRTPPRLTSTRPQTNGRPAVQNVPPANRPARNSAVTFLAGLGVGLTLGAAAALLLAPRSGADTRRAIRTRGRKIGNRARDAWEDLRLELDATRRLLKRKHRDARVDSRE